MKSSRWMRFCINKKTLLCLFLFIGVLMVNAQNKIDLRGSWQLFVDLKNAYSLERMLDIPFDDQIILPGSLDEFQKGNLTDTFRCMTHLSRKYSFYGKAWYRKEIQIPSSWRNKRLFLNLERTRVTHLWIDSTLVGGCNLISSPQQYDLTNYLSPGKHCVTLVVDNGNECGLPSAVRSSHLWTDDTQTNWNGILGEMNIEAKDSLHIVYVKSFPHIATKSVTLEVTIDNGANVDAATLAVTSFLFNSEKQALSQFKSFDLKLKQGKDTYTIDYPLGEEALLWSEFSPNLYQIKLDLSQNVSRINDSYSCQLGLREFSVDGKCFTINGQKTFLRGKHDACVFPLTGYAPMELDDWMRYFRILKSYGFNHVRCHSWCPPKAAFEAADRCGFYFQAELPIWGSVENTMDHPVSQYLMREMKGISNAFGNYASLVMFSIGNEVGGSKEALKFIVDQFRIYENRFLYAFGTNYHLGFSAPIEGEDYLVTCRVGGGNEANYETHVRSSFSFADAVDGGMINARYPNTRMDYTNGSSKAKKPVISHETGQFQIYPNAGELKKYTGVLYPYNLKTYLERANRKFGIKKTEQFFHASAALSLLCYKADMEMTFRSFNVAGYQMLDIQDYPGQGTALVGLLDAFMDSKGIITPEAYSTFNAPVVPLWVSDSYTWMNDTLMTGTVKLFNYSNQNIEKTIIDWTLTDPIGTVVKKGSLNGKAPQGQLSEIGEVLIDLSDIQQPSSFCFTLAVRNTSYINHYNVWVYPKQKPARLRNSVKQFSEVNESLVRYLQKGGTALLMPNADTYKEQTLGGLFTNDYWNYSMFKGITEGAKKPLSPGTLGYLINSEHPLFKEFPTEFHSDWQWWGIARSARPLIMDRLKKPLSSIVEAIDNMERNYALSVIFECKVGKGKLFVCMSDLINHLEYKECNQLYHAICDYLSSSAFEPTQELSIEDLRSLFFSSAEKIEIKGVKNISYE